MHDLSGLLKALELPAKVLLGVFISSLVLITADLYGLLELSSLWAHSAIVVIIVAVVSFCLLLASGVAFIVEDRLNNRKASILSRRRALLQKEKVAALQQEQSDNLLYLNSLSHEEKIIIATALRNNSMSITVPYESVGAQLLRSKGLGGFAGGLIDIERAAFTISPYAWKAIQAQKEAILSEVISSSNMPRRR